MSRIRDRVRRLECEKPKHARPRIIPFPITGMSDDEVEAALVQWRPLTLEEFIRKHGVNVLSQLP